MRIGIYARVSTQRQAQADGLTQQLDRLLAHALRQGWTVQAEHVFRDDGYSGASLKRPGLERLRDRAALRELDRVLITAPDRLARNYVHQVLLLEEITATGCAVEFLDRPMSQDPHDQLLLQIRGAVAEYERSLIAERMRRGRLRKLQAGVLLPWTRPPYGYCLDPDRPRDPAGVRLDAARAAVVSEMFAWSAEAGCSLFGLAKKLYRERVSPPHGPGRWNVTTLRRILTNPVYTGAVYAGRVQEAHGHGRDSHAPSPATAGGLDYGRVHPRPCQPGAVRPRAGQARSEPAVRPPQQHRSPVSPARPGQLWRVWALVFGPLPALGLPVLLLSRQALCCSLTPEDNVPFPLHSSRAGERTGLGGFVPVAERAGGNPLCPGAGARRALVAAGFASASGGAAARAGQRSAADRAAHRGLLGGCCGSRRVQAPALRDGPERAGPRRPAAPAGSAGRPPNRTRPCWPEHGGLLPTRAGGVGSGHVGAEAAAD